MRSEMENYPVLVIGGNHHNTLGVIRSLGEKGIMPDVIILAPVNNPYVGKSKYIKNIKIVQTEDQLLHYLRDAKYSINPVVISCADVVSGVLDCHYDELSLKYILPGSQIQGRITYLMDKEVMSELAHKVGFRIPDSFSLETNNTIDIPIKFPWIIKPLVSKDGSKAEIKRIYSFEEWNSYRIEHDAKIQIQQLIEKKFEYQLIGLSLDNGNQVIIPGVSVIIRPLETTNTGFLHYQEIDESYDSTLNLCGEFLKEVGYNGLFSMEFLRGEDDNDYFMEINFRNDGNAICVTAAGYNLPYIWYLYNTGGGYKEEIAHSNIRPVYVMPEFTDISLIKHGKLNAFTWIRDAIRTNRFMEFDRKDQKPFWYLLSSSIKAIFIKR